uniref:MIR domain-containing protein n=1 Tax=Salix viminalis TaxID=40686 RepID=A0A6N2KJI7_SALVM
MALAFLGLSIFLFLTLDLDGASFSPASASSSSSSSGSALEITYGSVIKLMHERTKYRLHSHDVPYGSGSGQQSVTGFPSVDDANSYWWDNYPFATHEDSKWLHSHLHASPISSNLEISCFGGENESDTGDYWRHGSKIKGSASTCRYQGYLHSHDKNTTNCWGQQEVCGVREKRADNVWLAAEGVYLPVTASK